MTAGQAGAEEEAVAALTARFLHAVSFTQGRKPDYSSLADLFSDGARLIKASGDVPEISTVAEFIQPRQLLVDSGELTSFEETEHAHSTELFGNVGHRISTYRKRGTTTEGTFDGLGMICTQFLRTPTG